MNAASAVILLVLAIALWTGLRARRGVTMDLAQWSVGGVASPRCSCSC